MAMNQKEMADIAHKMIPMLKQMEAFSISSMLEPIEDGTLGYEKKEMLAYVDTICDRIDDLVVRLKLEVQQ